MRFRVDNINEYTYSTRGGGGGGDESTICIMDYYTGLAGL